MSDQSESSELVVENVRSGMVESVHPVLAAVCDASGVLLAASGDPLHPVWWRSAAKPFQALPLVEDSAADALAMTEEELALACASHSSEPRHREIAAGMLRRLGLAEGALACGPHPPLGGAMLELVARGAETMTPVWSNCSGKHAGMLALAKHHGWPLEGYERAGHPVQERILRSLLAWTGAEPSEIRLGVDGCTAVCFALPLARMAAAYARLGAGATPAAVRVRDAMLEHPTLIAGEGRPCTELMRAWPGEIIAKVGAEGVYSAALPRLGVGVALKVMSGNAPAAPLALVAIVRQLLARFAPGLAAEFPAARLDAYVAPVLRNTRGDATGVMRAAGGLRFLAPAGALRATGSTSIGVS
jgi:L-asparaginase II